MTNLKMSFLIYEYNFNPLTTLEPSPHPPQIPHPPPSLSPEEVSLTWECDFSLGPLLQQKTTLGVEEEDTEGSVQHA